MTEAEKNFDLALAELEKYPEAHEASTRASEIVNYIASNVDDETLRAKFLQATRNVL